MASEPRADSALWLEATSGTDSSFGILFERYRGAVFRKAYGWFGNVGDAEDVVAMVFLEVWRTRERARLIEGSLLPWILGITLNVIRNQSRSLRRYRNALRKLPPADPTPDRTIESDDRLDAAVRGERLKSALGRLSLVEQQVVELALVEEMPLRDIASLLDLPIGTVKSKLHRSKEKLRGYIGPHTDAELLPGPVKAGEA